MKCKLFLIALGSLMTYFRSSEGHGFLMEPPSRSSMWRYGFSTPHNYNDNQLNCGGYYNQWSSNRGKCGICGDPFQQAQPRDNESGGKYGKGVISKTYTQGQEVDFKVMITANHFGWFEFRLCPDGSPTTPVTEACLDRYLLQLADGSGTRFDLGSARNVVTVRLRLPAGVTCSQCVIQWKWHAGNNYGVNPDMTSCMGCGPQEEFYGCADIAITGTGSNNVNPTFPNAPVTNPATFAPVQFDTFPPASSAQPRTTQPPATVRPSPVTLKPGVSGGFMPITLPTRGPQTITTGTTAGISYLPASFKPITPRPSVAPISTRPQLTVTTPQTPRPTLNNLPSSFNPITPRITAAPITFRPQATVTVPQTPRPTQSNLPSSFKPITPLGTAAPITFRPPLTTPQTIIARTTQRVTLNPSINNLPSSFKPITPLLTAGPIALRPQTTPPPPPTTQARTTQPPTPRPTTSIPIRFEPITPHPTAPLTRAPQTTQASTPSTTVYLAPTTSLAPFVPVTAKGPFVPLTYTPTPVLTNPTNPTNKPTTRPLFITFFRPSPTTTKLPTTTPTPSTTTPKTTPSTTTPTTTPSTTVKPLVITLGSMTPRLRPGPSGAVATPPSMIQGKRCYAINSWAGDKQLDQWCHAQCNTLGGTCPPEFCECV